MQKQNSLLNKGKDLVKGVIRQWKTPDEGKYVSYKEIASYSFGGTGVYFLVSLVGMIVLSASSMIVGASIGLEVVDLQSMNVASTLVLLLFAPIRAMLFDNTRSKMGKFRPYIMTMGLPTAILLNLLVWLPYENMQYNSKVISVFVVYTLLQFFSPFYQSAYSNLVYVLSPNSKERAWIVEISAIIYSLAPTIVNPVVPLIGPLEDIATYRIAFPVFSVVGIILSMLCVTGTRERVIQPQQYVQKMGFFEGLRKVSKNKYFWIVNLSSWIGFLNQGYSYLFTWVFYYGMNNSAIYAIMTVIKGEASTPGMLLGAPLTNKLGKKKICLLSIFVQAVCMALMLTCYKNYILFFVLMFIKDIFGALSIIYLPSMKADIMDYQQYKTGDRLEGFIEQSGLLIGSVLALGTGYVIPFILQSMGLTNNYEDLYSEDFRNPLIRIIIICSLVGTLLSAIPYLFYDLTEDKRSNMVKALKIRALFKDFEDGEYDEEKLQQQMKEIYELIKEYSQQTDENKKKALALAYDELTELKNSKAHIWQGLEEKYLEAMT